MGIAITARLKVLGSWISPASAPQDGQFTVEIWGAGLVSHRHPALSLRRKVVLRLLHQVDQSLGSRRWECKTRSWPHFHQALQQPQGLILVTGPTGSGKTVTLYGALQTPKHPDVNLCSVEDRCRDPDRRPQPDANSPTRRFDFSGVLRALLRQDPDIIMVGEIRDGETAEIALKAAQTGHLVLSTLHTNSTSETLVRLQQMGVARWMIASRADARYCAAVGQKVVPHCRQRQSTPITLPKLSGLHHYQNWQAPGCKHCYHGFYGRTALFEVLPVTPALRQVLPVAHP